MTGINQPDTILVLIKGKSNDEFREILFIKQIDEKQRIWNGEVLSRNDAIKVSAVEEVNYSDDFISLIYPMIKKSESVYLAQDVYKNFTSNLNYNEKRESEKIREKFRDKFIYSYDDIIKSLRLVKSELELDLIRKSVAITKEAYFRVLSSIEPNKFEYEIEAEMTYAFIRNGANGHAYAPIVASGRNACYLHYTDNDSKCKDGDLLLMDFGAEYAYYAADCSRTIPVNGQYSERQKECYNAVLEVYNKAKTLFTPENTIANVNKQVGEWMQQKMINLGLFTQTDVENQNPEEPLFKKYFMHGTSHFMGLDVHDVGDLDTKFKRGMVLTCEPGLYIPEENLGIRIETDIVVDDNPIDLMKDFPIEIDEIEELMKR